MLVETVTVAMVILAWRNASQKGQWTPERREMYEAALKELKDPDKLRKLAEHFDKWGFPIEGNVLRRRADLRATSPAVKEQRKAVFEKAMASTNVEAILRIADMFESYTATGSAARLREHARDVQIGVFPPAKAEAKRTEPEPQPESHDPEPDTKVEGKPAKRIPRRPKPAENADVIDVVAEVVDSKKESLNGSSAHAETTKPETTEEQENVQA